MFVVKSVSSPLSMSTLTPLSPTGPLSPLSPPVLVKMNPPTIVQSVTNAPVINVPNTVFLLNNTAVVDIKTGVNDNYLVQENITKFYLYKFIDVWLYKETPYLLKYIVIENDKARIVKNDKEKDSVEVSKDTKKELGLKADFIQENILSTHNVRKLLIRIMNELGVKWYDLPYKEHLVFDVIERYVRRKLKNMMVGK